MCSFMMSSFCCRSTGGEQTKMLSLASCWHGTPKEAEDVPRADKAVRKKISKVALSPDTCYRNVEDLLVGCKHRKENVKGAKRKRVPVDEEHKKRRRMHTRMQTSLSRHLLRTLTPQDAPVWWIQGPSTFPDGTNLEMCDSSRFRCGDI